VTTFMPTLNRISQTASDALTLLRILFFCDLENISVSILKQECGALYQRDRRDRLIASAVNELEAIIELFQSSTRLSKAIQEIRRLSLMIFTLKKFESMI